MAICVFVRSSIALASVTSFCVRGASQGCGQSVVSVPTYDRIGTYSNSPANMFSTKSPPNRGGLSLVFFSGFQATRLFAFRRRRVSSPMPTNAETNSSAAGGSGTALRAARKPVIVTNRETERRRLGRELLRGLTTAMAKKPHTEQRCAEQ
jgi:hypothetical protein